MPKNVGKKKLPQNKCWFKKNFVKKMWSNEFFCPKQFLSKKNGVKRNCPKKFVENNFAPKKGFFPRKFCGQRKVSPKNF